VWNTKNWVVWEFVKVYKKQWSEWWDDELALGSVVHSPVLNRFCVFSFAHAFVSIFCVRFPAHTNLSNRVFPRLICASPIHISRSSKHHSLTPRSLSFSHRLLFIVSSPPALTLFPLFWFCCVWCVGVLRTCRTNSGDQTTHKRSGPDDSGPLYPVFLATSVHIKKMRPPLPNAPHCACVRRSALHNSYCLFQLVAADCTYGMLSK